MTGHDFIKTQINILKIGEAVRQLDLDGFIAMLEKASNADAPPLVDPVLIRRAQGNFKIMKNFAEKLREVKLTVDSMSNEMAAEQCQ